MNNLIGNEPNTENYIVDDATQEDIPSLNPILEHWIKDRRTGEILYDEISEVDERIQKSIVETNGYKYFVIRNNAGSPVGIVGCRTPDSMTSLAKSTENPLEVVNFFVDPNMQGKGYGTKLLNQIFDYARNNQFTEILINSGPRYKNSAWDFYTKKLGPPIGIIKNAYHRDTNLEKSFISGYGISDVIIDDGDAPVWQKII